MGSCEPIVPFWEAESWIQNLEPSKLEDICTKAWFEYHKRLMHLSQQSIYEITNNLEETIKELFISYQKISVLIYEAIQISLWKEKVFPLVIKPDHQLTNSFMIYSIFYHENIAVSLIENILFHSDSIESLDDFGLDLIDYVVNNVTLIIFAPKTSTKHKEATLDELSEKRREIDFEIGMKSVSIIGYLSTFANSLPLTYLKRLLMTHDVPYLLTKLIRDQPWRKRGTDGRDMVYNPPWELVKPHEQDKICKVEGHVWFGLRELLLNPKCAPYYEITEFRASELLSLQKYLQENVLDQIAPLIDLRRWLSYLGISPRPGSSKPPISVEIIPEIRPSIVDKYKKSWKRLAAVQSEYFYAKDMDYIKETAQILSLAYDLDKIVINESKQCALCKNNASKRCSKCKSVWYCSRECQVKDWNSHKGICDKLISKKPIG